MKGASDEAIWRDAADVCLAGDADGLPQQNNDG